MPEPKCVCVCPECRPGRPHCHGYYCEQTEVPIDG